MELRRDDFPIALQAYDVRDTREEFVAEQVVNTQTEADNFMAINAGRLIKTRQVRPVENKVYAVQHKKRSGMSPLLVFVLILVALVIVGFATGWIPEMVAKYK